MRFLTCGSRIKQLPRQKMYKLVDNELYLDDDGSIYLAWRGFCSDNYTWINSSGYDIRCAHIHDVGCQYHQLVRVNATVYELRQHGYLRQFNWGTVCEDIPIEYLEVVDVTGHEVNNLFYRMLRDADCPKTPKAVQCLYRAGVSFNLHWFLTGKEKIDLTTLF